MAMVLTTRLDYQYGSSQKLRLVSVQLTLEPQRLGELELLTGGGVMEMQAPEGAERGWGGPQRQGRAEPDHMSNTKNLWEKASLFLYSLYNKEWDVVVLHLVFLQPPPFPTLLLMFKAQSTSKWCPKCFLLIWVCLWMGIVQVILS